MKKYITWLLLILLFLFIGCSQNESASNGLTGEKPPRAFVSAGNQVEEMVLGTYCWASGCVDTVGTVDLLLFEGKEPIKVKPEEVISLEIDYDEKPSDIFLAQVNEEEDMVTEIILTNDSFTAPTEGGIYYYSYGAWWNDSQDPNVSHGDAFYAFALEVENKEETTFTGTIEEIHGQSALVKIEEGEILKSGDRAYVDLSVNSEAAFKVGDKIRVGYDGQVQETYPVGIHVMNVELMN